MEASKNLTLENHSGIAKHVWDERGARHTLEPYEITHRHSNEIAKLFLTEHGRSVTEHVPMEIPRVPGERMVVVANWTGNPFLPETIFLEARNDTEKPQEIPNPLRRAVALRWEYVPAEKRFKNEDGSESTFRFPPIPISLQPLTKVPVSESIARWLVQRDALQMPHQKGKIRVVRDIGEFEPNSTWPLNDLLIYARMVDERFFSRERMEKQFPSEEACNGDQDRMRKCRSELWSYLFFRINDDEYSRPTREGFEKFKAQVVKVVRK